MNCPKCNTPNPDGQKFCGNCGAELPQKKEREFHGYSFTPDGKPIEHKENFAYTQNQPIQIKKKKKHGCLTAILSAFGLLFLFILVVLVIPDSDDSASTDTSAKQESTATNEDKKENTKTNENKSKEPELSPEEYKAQCQELNYNDVMRNPDQYKGQKFKITVQIYTASEKISSGRYFKTFTDDGSGVYFDKLVWVIDKRDDKADNYVKLLEGDTVTFYGEFDGLQKSKNTISDEKTEDLALNAYYADIVKEAE